tara:strand:+ start:222 stop:956 length:735 start_codon:yes stop_codon:yes gene_type:complete
MGRAKEIILKVIPSKVASDFVKKHHYSGKVVPNSKLHFGAFLDKKLHGVLSFGSPMDKSKVLHIVQPCLWNEMLELNRMAFDEFLPKYSESRCIAISIKLIKKNAPHIKWILSFSDGVSCGDGTIYRASGFKLIQINNNTDMWKLPNGEIISGSTLRQSGYTSWLKPFVTLEKFNKLRNGKSSSVHVLKYIGAEKLIGNQLKYIYLIDKKCKINVPIIPFSEIDKQGAGMYKGEKITLKERQNA